MMIIGVVEKKSPPEKQVVFRFHDLPLSEGDRIPRVYIYIIVFIIRWKNQESTAFQKNRASKPLSHTELTSVDRIKRLD